MAQALDPVLEPLLNFAVIKQGKGLMLQLGDSFVTYNPEFRLFITTKLAGPHFDPEVFAQCCVVDFSVTAKGLEEQLLSRAIMMEKPELELQRQTLAREATENRQLVQRLETELLTLLSSKENLLEDSSLIEVLNHTKATSEEIERKLKASVETEKSIQHAREEYRKVLFPMCCAEMYLMLFCGAGRHAWLYSILPCV